MTLTKVKVRKLRTGRQKEIDQLDYMFSKIIRLRAIKRSGGCERCHSQKIDYKSLQCMHYHSRRKLTTRWNSDNAAGGCGGCHLYLDSHEAEKIEFFKNLLGKETFELVNIQANSVYRIDLQAIKLYLKQELAKLEVENESL